MHKKVLFLNLLIFLFLPGIAFANIGFHLITESYIIQFSFIPIMAFIEGFVFWILIRTSYKESQKKEVEEIPFQKILLITFFATIVTTILGTLLQYSGIFNFIQSNLLNPLQFCCLVFILTVLLKCTIYIPFFRKYHLEIPHLLQVSFGANFAAYVVIFIIFFICIISPECKIALMIEGRKCPRPSMPGSEARTNLGAIRTAEEAYHAETGKYCPAKPSPPNGGTGQCPGLWVDGGGFSILGFEPIRGEVYYQYAIKVSEDGQSFTATAVGDIDEDGIPVIFTITQTGTITVDPKNEE